MHQIHVPDVGLGWNVLNANFPLVAGSLARPDHLKLRLLLAKLNVQQFTRFDRAEQALQNCTVGADVAHPRHLRKWESLGIHPPNSHRQKRGDPMTTAAIHDVV